MSRRNLLNLVLLIVVVSLVLITVYEPGKQAPDTTTLTSLDKQAIERIEIRREGADSIILEKTDGRWHMREPYSLPANDFKVKELLELVNTESHAQRDLSKLDASKYGLAAARAAITFNDGEPLRFGSTDPLNNRRYVGYKDTLHLITDTFYYQLGRAASDFLDASLLPGDASITALSLPNLTLRVDENGWQMEPTPQQTVSSDRINELIDNWQYAQALKIRPWNGKPEELQQRIRIERGTEQIIEFGLVSREPKFVLARPDIGLKYELAKDQYSELMQLPPKLETPEPTASEAKAASPATADE